MNFEHITSDVLKIIKLNNSSQNNSSQTVFDSDSTPFIIINNKNGCCCCRNNDSDSESFPPVIFEGQSLSATADTPISPYSIKGNNIILS